MWKLASLIRLSYVPSKPASKLADIVELPEFFLHSTEFQFRGNFYKQIHGTAMGSPVSVVVENLVMEDLKFRALTTLPKRRRLCHRFVDDTISVVKKFK